MTHETARHGGPVDHAVRVRLPTEADANPVCSGTYLWVRRYDREPGAYYGGGECQPMRHPPEPRYPQDSSVRPGRTGRPGTTTRNAASAWHGVYAGYRRCDT